jgi:hypothetical protein
MLARSLMSAATLYLVMRKSIHTGIMSTMEHIGAQLEDDVACNFRAKFVALFINFLSIIEEDNVI